MKIFSIEYDNTINNGNDIITNNVIIIADDMQIAIAKFFDKIKPNLLTLTNISIMLDPNEKRIPL